MKIPECPFTAISWNELESASGSGATGHAVQRQFRIGDVSVRLVEYSPGYVADHWCERGHIAFIASGQITVELKDGRSFDLKSGMSFVSSDDAVAPHRARTRDGATVFLVD